MHWYGQRRSGCKTCAVSWCARLVEVVCAETCARRGGCKRNEASFGGLCAGASVRFSHALSCAGLIEEGVCGVVCALVVTFAQWV